MTTSISLTDLQKDEETAHACEIACLRQPSSTIFGGAENR
jgi:hypothetical protein